VAARPVLPDDPDYQRLWEIVNKNNANRYSGYQKRTSRPIPVVELRASG
ncbi:MAG TPA: nitroreductase/quinone reductase family protein, partial [Mycobacterium sp.]|nr:nitroreductase/quinone reductase family protein [Mycobacterium sp.]